MLSLSEYYEHMQLTHNDQKPHTHSRPVLGQRTCDERHFVVELEPLQDQIVIEACQHIVFRWGGDAPARISVN